MEEPLLLSKDVQRILNVTDQTVYKYVRSGELKACYVGRKLQFRPEWVEEFVQKRKIKKAEVV